MTSENIGGLYQAPKESTDSKGSSFVRLIILFVFASVLAGMLERNAGPFGYCINMGYMFSVGCLGFFLTPIENNSIARTSKLAVLVLSICLASACFAVQIAHSASMKATNLSDDRAAEKMFREWASE